MAKELPTGSRSILNFRPVIDFVEPEQEPATPNPRPSPPPIIDDELEAERVRTKLFNLAESVDVLATAVQTKIDLKAKDMVIALDPVVDFAVIDALNREHPDAGDEITYEIYKHCRDRIMAFANEQAGKNRITEDQVEAARLQLDKVVVGGFNTKEAKNGKMRPDLHIKARLIDPIDMKKFQISLIKILVNVAWGFIIMAFDIRVAGVGIKGLLPDELPGTKLNKTEKKILKKLKKAAIPIPT